eukprot:11011634-Karenia_brevis.AAC.1
MMQEIRTGQFVPGVGPRSSSDPPRVATETADVPIMSEPPLPQIENDELSLSSADEDEGKDLPEADHG